MTLDPATAPPPALDPSVQPQPAYFALVMATGIVSIACERLGLGWFAQVLFWLNAVFFVALWCLMLRRVVRFPRAFLADLSDHGRGVGFFTWVAGTCVLATQCLVVYRLPRVATALWGLGAVLWLVVTYGVFTALTIKQQKPNLGAGLHGGWLVSVVATQSVSVASSHLAAIVPGHAEHLLFFALMTWLSGGMFYIWLISLIFYRYTFFVMSPADLSPPYWVNMGAMAISALAGVLLVRAAPESALLLSLLPFISGLSLFFWATATWWIPMLLILGAWRHLYCGFPIRYGPLYWGAVFPLGMYTTCSFELEEVLHLPFLRAISYAFLIISLTAWGVTFGGMCRSFVKVRPADPTGRRIDPN